MAQGSIDVRVEQNPGYLGVHFSGPYSPREILGLIDRIANESERTECAHVLVDITALSGAISDIDRHEGGRYAAQKLRTKLKRMAILTTLRRPAYLFEDTARNRGLPVRVFTEREAAIDWIKAP